MKKPVREDFYSIKKVPDVTYEYGVNEPDVLTGIKRNVHRAKHKLYQIQVVD